MAKGGRRANGDTFETEVRRRFGPVAERLGMAETAVPDHLAFFGGVDYRLSQGVGELTFSWLQDPHEGDVSVYVALDQDGDRFSISLDELVVGGRFGVGQDIRTGGRTWRALQGAVASHVEWIERLQPHLAGPGAAALIEAAGGRVAAPDAARFVPEHPDRARPRRPCP